MPVTVSLQFEVEVSTLGSRKHLQNRRPVAVDQNVLVPPSRKVPSAWFGIAIHTYASFTWCVPGIESISRRWLFADSSECFAVLAQPLAST